MIPGAAIESAARVIYKTSGRDQVMAYDEARNGCMADALEVLEAAAPHMAAAAWEAGAGAAWERSTPVVNGQCYHWRTDGEPLNPYRPEHWPTA